MNKRRRGGRGGRERQELAGAVDARDPAKLAPMTEYPRGPRYRESFQAHLAPGRLRYLAHRSNGGIPETRFESICDLGCGAGLTALVFAAANPDARVFGIDLNPEQIAVATDRARTLGLKNATFLCADIENDDLASLPNFDLITMSGLFSWISKEMREAIYGFLAHHTKVGGLAYVHYMSSLGWASYAPIRSLISAIAEQHGADATTCEAFIAQVLAELVATGYLGRHAIAHAKVKEFLRERADMRTQHFLNPHFAPLSAQSVHADMTEAGFTFLCDCLATPNRGRAIVDRLPRSEGDKPNDAVAIMIEELADFRMDRHDLFVMDDNGAPRAVAPASDATAVFPGFGDPLVIYRDKVASLDPRQRDLVDAILYRAGDGQTGLSRATAALATQFPELDVAGMCDTLVHSGILIPLIRPLTEPLTARHAFASHARPWLDDASGGGLLNRRRRIFVSPALAYGFRVGPEEVAALTIADRLGLDRFDHEQCHGLAETIAARHPTVDRAPFTDRVLDILLFFAREKRQLLRQLGVAP